MPSTGSARAAALAGSFGAVAGTAAAGAIVTDRGLGWYHTLDRPRWTPPDGAFGPVWSLLYAQQAVAAWLVWRAGDRRDAVDVPALGSYTTQLGLGLVWTLLFFGLRRPGWALLEVMVLWVAVAETVRRFAGRHRFAAALLLPSLAWVSYAGALTAGVWWRNRGSWAR
jgi:tryptophan-rich sensory protein